MALLSGLVVVLVGITAGRPPAPVRTLERGLEDQLVRLRGRRSPPSSVVLVAIDDSSLQQGAWFADQKDGAAAIPPWALGISTLPWPRARYADLLDRLRQAGPAVVGLNVVFEGESSRGPADDAALAAAIRRLPGHVALAAEMMEIRDNNYAGLSLVQPETALLQAAGKDGYGITNTLPAGNGEPFFHPEAYSRRVLTSSGARPQPSLTEVVLRKAHRPSLQPNQGRQLNFYGPEGSFQRISAWEVLDPQRWSSHPSRPMLRGAVVLVGPVVSQGGLGTITPFGSLSGLELLATATANSIQGDGLASWPQDPLQRGLLAMAPVLLVGALALWRSSLRWRLGLVGGVLALVLVGSFAVMERSNLWLPLLTPAAGLVLLGLLYGGDAYLREEGERRRLRRTFERYVAPTVVAEILSDPSAAEGILRGRLLPVTVLFTDLKGFTQLTQQRSGSGEIELHVRQLNRYLGEMVEVVTAHGGTIDKFIGDAVMAVFGSPLSRGRREEAVAALRCAQAMREALAGLNREWAEEGLAPFDNGIGLASGEVIVGQIGSPRRMEFTVIGDKVNLASRLEGLTRTAGVSILCDATTAELAEGSLAIRPMGDQQVKGMGAIPVFTTDDAQALPGGADAQAAVPAQAGAPPQGAGS
ncbi:CHASE2 domain-containing protein [Vulcanococcus limneticus]|uniref:CHASE2 domain-containing protein n=1 Tax=Vulcanococcus limneticus TaxID=2170428 RepID=UPI00398C1C07